ncbi:hypothetical protein [Pseudonocardia sp. H11422]|uniref:hypothetical protein n=1 Tax=Pseudonocardia sp. H11422 TaxID=2835866 RepID=UPI001BDCBD7E|nr:hypothetical protein [Pseudonocardia sp. H11422]
MDLSRVLQQFAVGRPHVLVVPVVGGTAARLEVEAELARRGWPPATTPADADVLVVAGVPGRAMTAVIGTVWRQVPAPRAWARVATPDMARRGLDTALAALRDPNGAPDARGPGGGEHGDRRGEQSAATPGPDARPGGHTGHTDHGPHAHHGGHGGGLALPGGLAMADLGEDRDGLALDRLHVPLGPVLPDWPAGLVLRVVLQGDVVQQAEVEVLAADQAVDRPFWHGPDERRLASRELDALGRLLSVAGWPDAALRARRLRDDLLAGVPADRLIAAAATLERRVRRSRTLRWLLRGIDAGGVEVSTWLERRFDVVSAALARLVDPALPRPNPAPPVDPAQLPDLLIGLELAAARLVVAALDPDTDAVRAPANGEARHAG